MSVLSHRTPAIETLQRMTSRLADSSLTIDEASLLRSMIHQLMDEISAVVPAPDRIVWPDDGRANRGGPVSAGSEPTGSYRVPAQERETSGASIPNAVARSV
ncbi:hypothetical protein SAMN05444166_5739 [Singulisphaera sp. GP187]|nr:hypothetical protein SAMN05444166_5739 [Singulisphaera sp. GP187]